MTLDSIIRLARELGASDVHLEGGMPAAMRVRGELRVTGDLIGPRVLTDLARTVLGEEWNGYLDRGSADLSRVVEGVRCRINIFRTARGAGFAIRLLSSFQATLKSLNLHPDLIQLVRPAHGLVLICGPTGSGKTSTLAALLQEINLREARHIITVENPIEYALTPRKSFVRQREVGRDTPSFAQALEDSLREDPDVLMVGEMRTPDVMRLTLNAAETGHLVLATMHSATVAEALQRVVGSFAAEVQSGICMQLADALVGAVAQRLHFRADLQMRVPECEVVMGSTPVRAVIRSGQFFKLGSAAETGAADGSWTYARYGEWLARKKDWVHPSTAPAEAPVAELPAAERLPRAAGKAHAAKTPAAAAPEDGPLEISDDAAEDLNAVIAQLERD